jgi:AraC family transcriptional regulator of adaptative response/methylated-DNA-[protein]-cysteine methyltransferase
MDTLKIETGARGEMLRALMDRDRTFDGLFFAGITTTMIFCRPSCPAKKPKPEHVEFYVTAREALNTSGSTLMATCRFRFVSWAR